MAVLDPNAYPFVLVGILARLYTKSYMFFGSYVKKQRRNTENVTVIKRMELRMFLF